MPTKIVFSPPMPKDIMDECRAMVPQGYELAVVERGVGGGPRGARGTSENPAGLRPAPKSE